MVRNTSNSASTVKHQTTEYGAAVLENELDTLRALDNGDFDKLFGVACRLVGLCKGGHIAEDDLYEGLEGAASEIRYARHKLSADIRKAFSITEARGPKGGNVAEVTFTPREPAAVEYVDSTLVEALWNATVPAVMDDDVFDWLQLRGINPRELEWQRLARVLPNNAAKKLPEELLESVAALIPSAKVDDRWDKATRHGYRLAVPQYDCEGNMRNLRLRRPNIKRDPLGNASLLKTKKSTLKELSLKGASVKGTVLANGLGVEMLKQRGNVDLDQVVIVEGVPDYLVASLEPFEGRRAVLAITGPGCWSMDIAMRIPFGVPVELAVHNDRAGAKYAKEILATLAGRDVHRWVPWSDGLVAITNKLTFAAGNKKLQHDIADVFGLVGGQHV